MRIHTPRPAPRESGDFPVSANPGSDGKPFATIYLSESWATSIALDSLDDADRLIRAAVSAKRKLEAAISRRPHEFSHDALAVSWCETCGLTRSDAIHDAPSPAAVPAEPAAASRDDYHEDEASDDDYPCDCGHAGSIHVAWAGGCTAGGCGCLRVRVTMITATPGTGASVRAAGGAA